MTEPASSDTMAKLFAHAATTRHIHVRVAVSYLPEQSAPQAGRWFWSYHVRIENDGDRPVQLLSRHWLIRDSPTMGRCSTWTFRISPCAARFEWQIRHRLPNFATKAVNMGYF